MSNSNSPTSPDSICPVTITRNTCSLSGSRLSSGSVALTVVAAALVVPSCSAIGLLLLP